jgi:hypothetical protein
MAKPIEAINRYRPRIVQGKAADEKRYMRSVTKRTTLSSGVVRNVQDSRKESLTELLLDGRPVHTGGAIYKLDISVDGTFTVNVKPDKDIVHAVNVPGAFQGTIINAENIGKTSSELFDMWDEDHPDNLVERPTTV